MSGRGVRRGGRGMFGSGRGGGGRRNFNMSNNRN